MAGSSDRSRRAWALAGAQDDLVSLEQLRELGFSRHAVDHRIRTRRLHPLWPGVYAVGRPTVSRRGMWRGAVMAAGAGATLSDWSAAALLGVREEDSRLIHVSVPASRRVRLRDVVAHRRSNLRPAEIIDRDGVPVTSPAVTLVQIAVGSSLWELDRAVNKADELDLIDPETLRAELERMPPRPGRGRLRSLLDRRTFVLTDSELERRFVPLVLRAGLPLPVTGATVSGFKVDFWWPDLGLVIETDGLRYHRTPAQQARDRRRDQAHTAAGLVPLRFTHAQIAYEANQVVTTIGAAVQRILERSVARPGHDRVW